MDLNSISQFISSAPTWYKGAVSIWVLVGALLFIRFLTFQKPETSESQNAQAAATSISQPSIAPKVEPPMPSFEEYLQRCDSLKDRFLELNDYRKSLNDREIHWNGYVRNVSEHKDYVILAMTAQKENSDLTVAFYSHEFRTKLFSLHKYDFVTVSGILSCPPAGGESIKANGISLLKSAAPDA